MTEEKKLLNLIAMANYHTNLYDLGTPIITDQSWDEIYFQIQELEEKLGIYHPHSPTQHIPYDVVNELKKVEHGHKMLSLQKTKDLEEVEKFLDNCDSLIMLKMDGLTCSLTYIDGNLVSAETRGNGLVGEDILHNARQLKSIPQYLPYQTGKLVIDGEIICTHKNFEEFASDYKNPRNFAAGSIRLLDSAECAKRKLSFVAWDVIEGFESSNILSEKFTKLKNLGFNVVPYLLYPAWDANDNQVPLDWYIDQLEYDAKNYGYPIDGLVAKFNSIEYGKTLGATSHHFKNAIAYKFYDETYTTRLLDIEWTMGRTGVLTPVAIFEPIDIDGSTVERASLHNVSMVGETFGPLGPHKFQEIEVFKANMIIPQIASASAEGVYEENKINFPTVCPVCGGEVKTRANADSIFMVCTNPDCDGKLINRIDHFCGKKGLDIKGLSKATLEKLIDWEWIKNIPSLFALEYYRDEWVSKSGFGVKSVDKILNAIDFSRNTCELPQFICALGIPLIGSSASKELCKYFSTYQQFREAIDNNYQFFMLPNFGIEMHKAIMNFDYGEADAMVQSGVITFKDSITSVQESSLDGLTFVITGKLNHFKNRDAIKDKIESLGGKVTGSVSKNTNYLINNDKDSTSSKNKSAKSLGIPILSEDDFIETFGIE